MNLWVGRGGGGINTGTFLVHLSTLVGTYIYRGTSKDMPTRGTKHKLDLNGSEKLELLAPTEHKYCLQWHNDNTQLMEIV